MTLMTNIISPVFHVILEQEDPLMWWWLIKIMQKITYRLWNLFDILVDGFSDNKCFHDLSLRILQGGMGEESYCVESLENRSKVPNTHNGPQNTQI